MVCERVRISVGVGVDAGGSVWRPSEKLGLGLEEMEEEKEFPLH